MVRSRFIYSQNSLYIFLAASAVVHLLLFAGLKIDLSAQAVEETKNFRVRLEYVKAAAVEAAAVEAAAETVAPAALETASERAPAPVETVDAEPEAAPEPDPVSESVPVPAPAAETAPAADSPPVILGSFGAVAVAADSAAADAAGYGISANTDFVSYDSLAVPGVKVPKPAYPEIARRWGHEGTVILELLIAEDGTVKKSTILKSSGFDELDNAAKNTVMKRWKFFEQPQEVKTRKEFEFRLNRETAG